MTTLAVAIQRKQWELAALCLLLGVTEAVAALPPDAVEGLLEVLAALEVEETRTRGGARPFGPSTLRLRSGQAPLRAGRLRAGRGRRR